MTSPANVRDRAVDVARLASLVVVMVGHCVLLLATRDSAGLRIGNLIGEVPAIAPLTWLAQVMPLFFVAGGAAGGYGYRRGIPWGTWLLTRAQRLCRPVFWYLGAWTVGLIVVRLAWGGPSAERLGRESVALLWFLGVYLVALAFVPALTRLPGCRAVVVTVVGLLALSAAIDGVRFATGTLTAGAPNFVVVWLIPVVIGVGYARGLIPRPAAAVGAALALGAAMLVAVTGPYDHSLVVTGAEKVSNVTPPTALLALHCTWMSCAFVVLAPALRRWAAGPRVWGVVVAGNRAAMTLYLWHIPAIAVAALGLNAVGLDAWDVHAPGFLVRLLLRMVVFVAVMTVFLFALAPLEHRRLPWWDDAVAASGARAVAAGAAVCAAGVILVLMAKWGLAGAAGWWALSAFVATTVVARSLGARSPRVHRTDFAEKLDLVQKAGHHRVDGR